MSDIKQSGNAGGDNGGEFDRDLALASRAYKSATPDMPTCAMDDAIRAAARRAVKSQPHAVGKSWVARWSTPISAAALVVLTVSVGFLAIDERPELAPAPLNKIVNQEPTATATSPPIKAVADGAPATEVARANAPPAPASAKKQDRQDAVIREQFAEPDKPSPARKRNEAANTSVASSAVKETRMDARSTVELDRQLAAAAPAPAPAAPPAIAAREATGFVADAPAAIAAQRPAAGSAAATPKREAVESKQVAEQAVDATALKAKLLVAQRSPAAAAPPQPTIASAGAVSQPVYATPAAPQQSATKVDEPADVWMKRILELKRQGKVREFDEELVKFRKRYPDFVLPEELKAHK